MDVCRRIIFNMNWSMKKFNGYCIIDLPENVFQEKMINELKEVLKEISDNGYDVIFLNMGQITKVCSKSLSFIINIYKVAFMSGIEIKLYNLQPYVSQLIYQTRLNQIFDICNPDSEFSTDFPQELCSPQACRPLHR